MELRCLVGEHFLGQIKGRNLDHYRATARERYELLMQRCPGIVQHLPLIAIASFLCITPQMLSKIRKDITFEAQQLKKNLKLVSYYYPRQPFSWLCRGLFCAVFRNFELQ